MASGYGNPSPDQLQQSPAPSMFGNFGQGMQGMFGGLRRGFQAGGQALHPYSNRLLLAGMGMLSRGPDAMGQAMKGMIAGSALDTEDRDRRELNKALQDLMNDPESLSNLSSGERNFALHDAETARLAVAQQLKPDDVGETYKNYQRAVADGSFSGGFYEYQKALQPAGTTISTAGETAYNKTVGEGFGKDYLAIQQGARDASSTIGKLDRLGNALSSPGVYTGAGGELVADLKKTATGLGIPMEGVAETDVARSISNEITLQLRNPAGGAGMPGAMSDADRQFLSAIPPGLSNTPEGNRQKLDMLKKVQQRNIDVAQFANKYVQSSPSGQLDAGFYQALAEWAKANPLFPEGDTPAELQSLKKKYGLE